MGVGGKGCVNYNVFTDVCRRKDGGYCFACTCR